MSKYKILYLPTGAYIKRAFSGYSFEFEIQETDYILDSKTSAERLIFSMVRTERPPHNGFMDYNNIIFPSIIAHFEIIEDKNE